MEVVKLFIIIWVYSAYVTAEEVCVWETFKANCSTGQVVFIETAFYGRMNENRCVNLTENETVCAVDMRQDIHKQYGLMQQLQFKLTSELFTKIKLGCDSEPFLDITHRCTSLIKKDICVWEAFEARCQSGSVILIKSAFYGRKQSSRCIEYGMADLNCYVNVQIYLESKCNGRSFCRVPATDPQLLLAESTCPSDKKPYLEVEYTCGHGFTCPQFNPSDEANLVRTSDGYKVTCPNETIVKDLLCKGGIWSRDPEKICSNKESHLFQTLLYVVPAVVLLVSVVSVAILLHRMQKKAQRRTSAEDEYTDYPESHLRRNGATCSSEYDEYGDIDDGTYACYSEVRDTGP